MALVLITHNMGVVAETAQRVMVMYAGQIMEERGAADLFAVAAASLYGGAARGAAGAQRRRPARHDSGRRAGPLRPAARLPVQPALRLRDRRIRATCGPDLRAMAGRADPLPLSARRPDRASERIAADQPGRRAEAAS